MGKLEIKKTELVWKGKYDDDGKLIPVEKPGPFPFQIVESINDPRIEKGGKEAEQTTLFDVWKGDEGSTFEDGWKNKLIWGDNRFVMSSLIEKFAGKIDLIYIDPPFATGANFKANVEIGENRVTKEHSILEEKAYRDTWGNGLDSFLPWMYERLQIMRDLLSQKGSIYIHLDWHAGQYVKTIIDEVFGYNYFRNEIIWHYRTGNLAKNQFQRKHDNIFFYSKSDDLTFNVQEQKEYYTDIYGPDFKPSFEGRKQDKDEKGIFRMATVDSVWDISAVFTLSKEHLPYDTQKPEALLERIIKASSNEGDLIADFFCGSGTTMAVAEKLNRRWIGVDFGRFAIHTTRKRLLEIGESKSLTNPGRLYGLKARPFEILNLGKYERQFWQVKAFGRKDEKQAMHEYISFILKLYSAEPISGSNRIHGKKGNALVYIGAVDSPVTIQEVTDGLHDTKEMGMKELHVLGWEWEMGLNDAIQEVAKQSGVRLKLRIIPMDAIDPQAAGKGDIKFFELAYFKAKIETKGLKIKVRLEDFVIPHTDLVPNDVKESINKWSDWVDYWAVDFDFQNDTFNNSWTSYRTKQDRKLKLIADHEYTKPGTYKVFVKIIDIFGIDTSQVYETKIK